MQPHGPLQYIMQFTHLFFFLSNSGLLSQLAGSCISRACTKKRLVTSCRSSTERQLEISEMPPIAPSFMIKALISGGIVATAYHPCRPVLM